MKRAQRTNIKSSIFALLVELVNKVAKHSCRNQRESIDYGNTEQDGNSLIVEKKLTLRIKFIFGSFPPRNETFWCFLLACFPPLLFSDLLSFFSSPPENHLKPATITKTKRISKQKKLKPYERECVCVRERK